jgi:hypothetical protein
VCSGLRCVAGESWRDGRGRDGLVQRGTRKGSGVVFLCSSMSHGPGSGQERLGIDKGVRGDVLGYG